MEQDHLISSLHEIATDGVAIGFGFSSVGEPADHLCTYKPEWQQHYWDSKLIFRDPVIAFGIKNLGAVRWSDIERTDGDDAVSQARDFGMKNGIVLSVQVDGERAIAGLATEGRPSETAIKEARVILAALQAAKTGDPAIILTPRQRDILRLIADGASAADTAHELQIDVSTVNFHKRAALKRNSKRAKNFTALLAQAVRSAAI